MKINKKLLLLVGLFIFISCNNNYSKININETNKKEDSFTSLNLNEIKKYIELQKRVETEEEEFVNPHNLSIKDLELASNVVLIDLKRNGFKKITEGQFQEKLQRIFKIDLHTKCIRYKSSNEFITLFGYEMDGNINTLIDSQYDLFNYTQNNFISEEDYFLLKTFLLREIITVNQDNTFQIKVPKDIVEKNKYLFNDSHASFTWLKINDPFFLESLVKTFGYYEDQALSMFVLDRSLSDNAEFGKVLWNKDCQDKLVFNKEIFSIIKALPEDERKPYFDRISHYLEFLLVNRLNQEMVEVDLTFSQKTEMLAKLAYYATKATGNEGAYYYSFFNFLNSEEFINEFEKQNHYNLKDFKPLFEETKSGGVGLPM